MYKVLIVEDDFRVANINKEFVEKIDGFHVTGIAYTRKDTLEALNKADTLPDIILLDIYIPDVKGMGLMWEIRNNFPFIDMIILTAATEVESIEEALRGGIFDYIIKPVQFNRLQQTFSRYIERQKMLGEKGEFTQEEIDILRGDSLQSESANHVSTLPKGIDQLTLHKVKEVLQKRKEVGWTAAEVGEHIGASRSTARRYLEYLVSKSEATAELMYGDVGRPERRYIHR